MTLGIKSDTRLVETIERAKRGFDLMFSNRTVFEDRLRKGLSFGPNDPNIEQKIQLTQSLPLFSYELFQAMVCGGEAYSPAPTRMIWNRLVAAEVAFPSMPHIGGQTPFVDHQLNMRLLWQHLSDDTFENLFAPPSRLLTRYRHALVAIDVMVGDQPSRGTGFVVRHKHQEFLFTCKHNVDPAKAEVSALTNIAGVTLKIGPWWMSDRYDIAIAMLADEVGQPCFAFSQNVEVFDEVFTLGFPAIPCANSILAGHRGEVNARAELYLQKCPALIISNLVAPGNSGGPVLSRYGHCVGMTINWLEGQLEGQAMRFSAALPADVLSQALEVAAKA